MDWDYVTNIFNADEFGLFYQSLSNKTLHLKGEKYSGGKRSKIRLRGWLLVMCMVQASQCLALERPTNQDVLQASEIYCAVILLNAIAFFLNQKIYIFSFFHFYSILAWKHLVFTKQVKTLAQNFKAKIDS